MNVETFVADIENGALEARAFAIVADEFDIGQELHFDGDGAIALTGFAAAAGDVEGKVPGGVAAFFGIAGGGEDAADRYRRL